MAEQPSDSHPICRSVEETLRQEFEARFNILRQDFDRRAQESRDEFNRQFDRLSAESSRQAGLSMEILKAVTALQASEHPCRMMETRVVAVETLMSKAKDSTARIIGYTGVGIAIINSIVTAATSLLRH